MNSFILNGQRRGDEFFLEFEIQGPEGSVVLSLITGWSTTTRIEPPRPKRLGIYGKTREEYQPLDLAPAHGAVAQMIESDFGPVQYLLETIYQARFDPARELREEVETQKTETNEQ